jgi:hypothetical protein
MTLTNQQEETMGSNAGRRTKRTPERVQALVEALRAGNYIEASCSYAGISVATYYNWVNDAEKDDATPEAIEFLEAVSKARADAEVRNVSFIQRAASDPRHWSAAAWWLERSHPTRWGRQQRLEVTGADGGPIQIEDPRAAVLAMFAEVDEQKPV